MSQTAIRKTANDAIDNSDSQPSDDPNPANVHSSQDPSSSAVVSRPRITLITTDGTLPQEQNVASHISPTAESSSQPTSSSNIKRPDARRTPSKVPGDYDPVTGYYRRKSDADVTADEESPHISPNDVD
jgi:hypothetical protein